MIKKIFLALTLSFFLVIHLWSQADEIDFSSAASKYKGFYVTSLWSSITKFPLSYMDGPWASSVTSCSSSTPVFSVGYAYAGFWKVGYIAGEFEFHLPKFSDYRVSDRLIPTWNLILDIGILLPLPAVPVVIYGTIGMGWMHQNDYDDNWLGDGILERLDKNIFAEIFGFGIKLSPLRRFILEFELKFLREPYASYEPGTYYVPAGTDPASHGSNPMGQRMSFGLTYIFTPKLR